MSGPVLSGFCHWSVTVDRVLEVAVGAVGLPGGSSTSVMLTVTSMVSLPPWPSCTCTLKVCLGLLSWS